MSKAEWYLRSKSQSDMSLFLRCREGLAGHLLAIPRAAYTATRLVKRARQVLENLIDLQTPVQAICRSVDVTCPS